MKKKIKELTFGEIVRICKRHKCCDDCPIEVICANSIFECGSKKILEKEIEV